MWQDYILKPPWAFLSATRGRIRFKNICQRAHTHSSLGCSLVFTIIFCENPCLLSFGKWNGRKFCTWMRPPISNQTVVINVNISTINSIHLSGSASSSLFVCFIVFLLSFVLLTWWINSRAAAPPEAGVFRTLRLLLRRHCQVATLNLRCRIYVLRRGGLEQLGLFLFLHKLHKWLFLIFSLRLNSWSWMLSFVN